VQRVGRLPEPPAVPAGIAGLLLAAGAGRRYGQPKALVDSGSGPWVRRALDALAGCGPRVVVVGAGADQVIALLPDDVRIVRNPAYAEGMGSSLRAGLLALTGLTGPSPAPGHRAQRSGSGDRVAPVIDAALVMLVDLPGVGGPVVRRVCAAAGPVLDARKALLRASYDGTPGHPVLLGRDHWAGVIATAAGDSGARDYLRAHPPTLIECGDVGSGQDVDTPARFPAG